MPSSKLHSPSPSIFKRARRASATTAALTLLLSMGCGTAADELAASDPTQEASTAEASRESGRPAHQYTEEELEALADSPEVLSLKEPWVAAPPRK